MTIIDNGVDLPGFFIPKTSFVADPWLANTVEIEYGVVDLANPTHDPNRMTLHVPTETTVLSIGAPSPTWKTDQGIVGYSDNHVHFETKVNDKTVVSLGSPATTAGIRGHGGHAPVSTEGYSMVTTQNAWHESNGQHYLLSHEEDISIRTLGAGKRAVVQADQGFVDVNGGEEVTLSAAGVAVGAAEGVGFEPVPYDGHFSGKPPKSAWAKYSKLGMDMIGAVFSAHDLGLKAHKTYKKGFPKKWSEREFLFFDTVKWLGDAAKFAMSVNKIKKVFADAPTPPGCIKIGAEKHVTAVAGADVSFSGLMGASLASTGATSIAAGLMATLKGTLFAGVGSVLTSIKAQKKLEVASTWGDVAFSAKQNVEFTADEHFVAAAVGDAQINGKKHLLFGGEKRTFIGAEPGWGALFDDKGVAFGKAAGLATLTSATIEATQSIRIDPDKIEVVGTDGAFTLSNDLALFEAPGIRLDAKQKNVTFNGSSAKLAP
jgi:hypothetical protein